MWMPPLLITEGARVLDEAGRERTGRSVPSEAIEPLLGGDVWEAGFVRQLRPVEASDKQLELRLSSEKAGTNGSDLVELICRATCGPDVIRRLERLYMAFPSVAPRVAAVHDFLDAYRKRFGDGQEIAFFLNRIVPRRGRRMSWGEELQLVCWMNQLVREGSSAARAAALLKEQWPQVKHLTAETLRNKSSLYREYARIFAEGYFVPASSLRPEPWGSVRRKWRMISMH
jgi:hypothetical protein